jgi:O-antigen/teichoic acid export membrane protein
VLSARWLGPEGRGELYIAVLTAVTVAQVLGLSLGASIQFHVGRGSITVADGLGLALLYSLGVGLVAVLVGAWLASLGVFGSSPRAVSLTVLASVLVPLDLITQTAYPLFITTNRVAYRALLEVGESVTALALLITFVGVGGEGVIGAAKSIVIAAGLVALATLVLLGSHARVTLGALTKTMFPRILAFGVRTHGSAIAARAMKRADSYIVLYFLGAAQLGIYSAAVSLSELPLIVARPLQTLIFSLAGGPANGRVAETTARLVRLLCVGLPVGYFLFAVVGLWAIPVLYGAQFGAAGLPFVLLLAASFCFSLYVVLAGYLAGSGRPELPTYAMFVGALVNIGLTLALIPVFGLPGDATATVAGAIIALTLTLGQFSALSGKTLRETLVLTSADQQVVAKLLSHLRIQLGRDRS